ncbi:GNAT family N-acetyltransferase [Paenibacillus arenilitoris]|uniref:GNAT family N-acetyltransferase n=1 Tax=Paenibacillus arenilitoris TaxID=2772299 RepID=A0A927H462_9BACL|nr:GNAT family N-acetyltransferase [Paenibacillus arenilitoris]MBD2867575.1 GNAT family N-acetyltransferase [Paenibacillus arenilitoris]
MLAQQFRINQVSTAEEAERIVAFLLSDHSFDDTRYTPGELVHFRELPYRALKGELLFWYAEDASGQVVGINCVAENEQQTGGFSWDYIVVHRHYRKSGVAASLIEQMFLHMQAAGARYIITYTCDLPEYSRIRQLFERNGFALVGRCPDYYYKGEDRLIYYRKLV